MQICKFFFRDLTLCKVATAPKPKIHDGISHSLSSKYHYQLQVHKNPMKYLWKTHESFFRAMNIAFSNFHGLIETH